MALRRIVLQSLTPSAGQVTVTRAAASPAISPFARPSFRPMRLIAMKGDHVVASVDGSIGEYAFGHLPPSARALIRAPGVISAMTAGAQQRTMLGILSDNAIDDIHDEDPFICPVALAIIRAYAPDPRTTLRSYIAAAPHVGSLEGQETTPTGQRISYQRNARRLTAEWRGGNWNLLHDRIEIDERLPTTTCLAAIGRPLCDLLDHQVLADAGATVTGMLPAEWGTEIVFEAKPVRARKTDEAANRRER